MISIFDFNFASNFASPLETSTIFESYQTFRGLHDSRAEIIDYYTQHVDTMCASILLAAAASRILEITSTPPGSAIGMRLDSTNMRGLRLLTSPLLSSPSKQKSFTACL